MKNVNDEVLEISTAIFGLVALYFGYRFTRRNGDSFVALVCFIVAFVAFGWLYWN